MICFQTTENHVDNILTIVLLANMTLSIKRTAYLYSEITKVPFLSFLFQGLSKDNNFYRFLQIEIAIWEVYKKQS